MTMEGIIERIGTTQKGSPFLVINGVNYYAGRCDISSLQAGQKISFEASEFAPKRWGLDKWGLMPVGGRTDPVSTVSVGGPEAVQSHELACVSNVLAHAIAAGKIEGPTDILAWVNATKTALRGSAEEIPFGEETHR